MESEYKSRLEKIEEVLAARFPAAPGEAWLRETFPGLALAPGHAEALAAPGLELLARGGKRWRPLLALLACEALGGGGAVLPLLPLVEFPHNASLIHDDIEDNSALRRGKPAVHLIFGADAAINSGSFLYFLPLTCIEAWPARAEARLGVWELWAEHIRRLHLGQAMDIAWHRDFLSLPTLDDYFLMCGLKTGSLARFAALLGTKAAETAAAEAWGETGKKPVAAPKDGEEAGAKLGRAAEKLGVGFQILDDVKNLERGVPGKERGDDIVEGKKSLPVLLYLRARPEKAEFAAGCFRAARAGGVSAPETEALIAELARSGALGEARARGEALVGEATALFAEVEAAANAEPAGSRGLLSGLPALLR